MKDFGSYFWLGAVVAQRLQRRQDGRLYLALVAAHRQDGEEVRTVESLGCLDEFAALSCTNIADNWWVLDHRSEALDDLCRVAEFDASRRSAQSKDIKAMFAKAKQA